MQAWYQLHSHVRRQRLATQLHVGNAQEYSTLSITNIVLKTPRNLMVVQHDKDMMELTCDLGLQCSLLQLSPHIRHQAGRTHTSLGLKWRL
jgi:hypothetical protein